MAIQPRTILATLGVFDEFGNQVRAVDREDVLEVIEVNQGAHDFLDFRGIDFEGADLRGLSLYRCGFEGCNLSRVNASPMVTYRGRELAIGDLAITETLDRWSNGEPQSKEHLVTPTSMEGCILSYTTIKDAYFGFAQLEGCSFYNATVERTVFYSADLSTANFRFARFVDVDWRCADLRSANLYALTLQTSFLDDSNWGTELVILQEAVGNWDEALNVYRMLSRVHELAGMNELAGEFRFRQECVESNIIYQRALSLAGSTSSQPSLPRRWLSSCVHGGWKLLTKWLARRFYHWIAGYGHRPWRVLRAIALFVFVSAFLYIDYSPMELSLDGVAVFTERLFGAVYFSAASATALGYGSWVQEDTGWNRYIGVCQSFIGSFLNALFLVTFTRRWTR